MGSELVSSSQRETPQWQQKEIVLGGDRVPPSGLTCVPWHSSLFLIL